MKIIEWIKIINLKKKKTLNEKVYSLAFNDQIIADIKVVSHQLHSQTYKLIRNFVSPRYDIFYLFRNKKGFNTFFFKQHYDIIICDRNFKVIKLFINQEQGFVSEYFPNGYFIFFAPVGSIKFLNLKIDDRLRITRNYLN